ncbi:MAG: Nif3-like dinuclear metal center hexameric protein, partial [Cocleimonas sp.]
MESITTITTYIDGLLDSKSFDDYSPNGLQVQGKTDIRKIVTGVSATQAFIEAAIEKEADAILVHHGWFWDKEDPRIVGMKYKRLKLLMDHDISLLGYHLPLDAHP